MFFITDDTKVPLSTKLWIKGLQPAVGRMSYSHSRIMGRIGLS
ncbi:hypothetical protein AEGHOMDF_3481 [Methylobacterium soli]|nr:hypothetical protein AEGHOMDF_3481 [Methylobacterium soli]